MKVAVLISGRGSNLQALIDAGAAPGWPAEIVLVISNVAGSEGLERAGKAGIATAVIDHKTFDGREPFDKAMTAAIEKAGAEFVCLAGFMVILMTIYQNSFAAPIVKDQSDRGQTLVDTGLYSRVRHPMYTGILLWLAGLALWLESTAAAIGVLALVPFFLGRILAEERFLRDTLEGYGDYTNRVRHRLIPFVW